MRKLSPEEEIQFVRDLHQDPIAENVLLMLRESFNVMQTRAQVLLGLVTICLTITGFSGIRIAQSGFPARIGVFVGIISVLVTAILLVFGPLLPQWLTQARADSIEDTLACMIRRRNRRTSLYRLATAFLIIGFCGYVLSLAFFLLSGSPQ